MRSLILGGNGFIGSHLVDELLDKGHYVRVFDRCGGCYRDPIDNVDYHIAQFNDSASLAEALEGIDVVFHLISTTVPSTSNKDPVFDIESNLVGTVRLLNLMRDSNVSRIVYLSSGGTVYGIPTTFPIPESHSLNPICSYGIVKVAIEHYLQMFDYLYGIESAVLRVSNPYGERQGHKGVQGVIGTFIGKLINGEEINVWGDGSVVRDYIYVKDLTRLCALIGAADINGVFNVGSGIGHSVNDIISVIQEVCDREVRVNYNESRVFDVPQVVLDTIKAQQECGWSAQVELRKGIESTWRWMQKN